MDRAYHAWTVEQVAAEFQVDPDRGLAGADAAQRLVQYGPNVVRGETTASVWALLFRQLASAMTLVLAAAVVLSFVTGDYAEAIVVCAIIVANTVIGFYQEYKAERTMAALRSMASPTANVVRDGEPQSIPAADVVPGDVVLLKSGDNVPADCRLVACQILGVDEALLTGETHQVDKHCDVIGGDRVSVADQHNMAFASTLVTQGRARAVAVRTVRRRRRR